MLKKTVSGILLILLLTSVLILAFNIPQVKADAQTVYINADGSITPSTAPITTSDNITYTLNGNISYPTYCGVVGGYTTPVNVGIVVERSNIVIDGNGFTVQGNSSWAQGSSPAYGLSLTSVSNVTVENVNIQYFEVGILISLFRGADPNNNSIIGNTITNTCYGIYFDQYSNNNTAIGNNITANNGAGIIFSSSYNSISGNTITTNGAGIYLSDSISDNIIGNNINGSNIMEDYAFGILDNGGCNYTSITGNNIAGNAEYGIVLDPVSINDSIIGNNIADTYYSVLLASSSNNTIYHNNFVGPVVLASVDSTSVGNVWDNGYPSGGNYWSDYQSLYPNAAEIDNSSIWNTPYVIDASDIDHYPLMNPYVPTGLKVTVPINAEVFLVFDAVTAAGFATAVTTISYPPPPSSTSSGSSTGSATTTSSYTPLSSASYFIPPVWIITTTAKFSGMVTVGIAYPSTASPTQMWQTDIVPGDVNHDGVVNLKDLLLILQAMGSSPGSPRWNPNCDLDGNRKIDIGDLLIALKNYGKTSKWTNITWYVDTVNHIIYGRTDHFSLIAIH